MKKNNKGLIVILIVFIVCFVFLAAYLWYHFFLKLGLDGLLNGANGSNGALVLKAENSVYATYEEGEKEEINIQAYKFKVQNRGIKSARYNLIFTEISPKEANDGCTEVAVLKKDQLKYQLLFNDNVISEGKLNNLENNLLDSRVINPDKTNNYQLKVWLDEEATGNQGKHFHYKVDLQVVK